MHKTHFAELVHEEANPWLGRADHHDEGFLTDLGNEVSGVLPARFRQTWSQLNCLATRFSSMLLETRLYSKARHDHPPPDNSNRCGNYCDSLALAHFGG
jgi:hypothetical protein